MRYIKYLVLALISITIFVRCAEKGELGTESNPIKMYFVPSMEAGKILTDGKKIADMITEDTGLEFDVAVPTSYAAVIEAMGTKEADVAWLPTFAYILAHQKYDAKVGLTTIRNNLKKYRGQFVARADSKIDTLEDINGKIIAYTDAASTSGYIYPSATLQKKGIKPKKHFFAGGHPQAIISVYEGTADVGCSFWSPKKDGEIHDARRSVKETYPDVEEKIKIVGFTDWIPNDTVTFRAGLSKEIRDKVINSLMKLSRTEEGKKVFKDIYDIDGFYRSDDSDYDVVRKTLDVLNVGAEKFINE